MAASDSVPGSYVTGRATRREIIARAAEAFSQQGFHGASLRGIARSAGVDHSTLIHHFGNKTKLLRAVLEWHDGHSMAAQPAIPKNPAELADAFVEVARYNQTVPGLVQLHSMLSAEAAAEDHPARDYLKLRHQVLVDLLANTIAAQRTAGALTDDGRTPAQHAILIIATWDGLQLYESLHPGEINVPALLGDTLRGAFGLPAQG